MHVSLLVHSTEPTVAWSCLCTAQPWWWTTCLWSPFVWFCLIRWINMDQNSGLQSTEIKLDPSRMTWHIALEVWKVTEYDSTKRPHPPHPIWVWGTLHGINTLGWPQREVSPSKSVIGLYQCPVGGRFSKPRGNPCVRSKKTLGQVVLDSCQRLHRPLSSVIMAYNMFFLSWWSSRESESIWHLQCLQGSSWRIKACKNTRRRCSCEHSTLYPPVI